MVVISRHVTRFFLNNTLEVYKELLVRYHEVIQHFCMSILVLNKTISFTWLWKIMQILSISPKVLGSSNRTKPRILEPENNFRSKRLKSGTTPWIWEPCKSKHLGSRNHTNLNTLGLAKVNWAWQPCVGLTWLSNLKRYTRPTLFEFGKELSKSLKINLLVIFNNTIKIFSMLLIFFLHLKTNIDLCGVHYYYNKSLFFP